MSDTSICNSSWSHYNNQVYSASRWPIGPFAALDTGNRAFKQSELDELRDEAHDLITDVLGASDLTAEQKRAIVAHLRAVEDTLMSALLGDDDLIRANDGLVGSIIALPHRVWRSDAIRTVAKFAASVTMAVAVNVATQAVENAIEPPKPPSVVLIERIAHGDDIPAITSSQNYGEVVDAVVIEDGQPSPER